ncbi:acetyl-coenzyme A transporter 1-domain-containing protein [Phascolomyces articulosus]|uniref:Acetyl-coenzyme A transporter 1-domain-containing protein n=1 Tax=Phascolomyces articulosus TaxID=60185 RepID=A0AAD5K5Y2_9FUNG|nr:acetyl-coenzyme A transporter 1-domain-containing protein [Phascolomyces articulosus]
MPAAYVYPTLDDEPLVHITASHNNRASDNNTTISNKPGTSTTAMDPSITAATTQRRKEILIAEDDKEEIELDSLSNTKDSSNNTDHDTPTNQPETLRKEDLGNFILLVILYLLQGVPVGLSFGSIPFLLKEKLSYSQIAVFSLSSWPYSLKFLWSPIVDAVYSPNVGRRKSWIIPIQIMTGFLFLLLGKNIDALMEAEHVPVYYLTGAFLVTIFFCATQDIAVDGWALTLLSKDSLSYASTAQTIGLNTGYFMSFTVFLALSSPEFSNKYIWSEPQEYGIVRLGAYMKFWAFMYFAVTAWLMLMKKENSSQTDEDQLGIRGVYTTIWKICKLPHLRSFIVVLLTAKIGFICHEAVTSLKLLEKGFSKEDLALSVLLDFPLQIFFGYYAAKWSNGPRPLKPWLWGFYGRLLFSAIGMLVVYFYPSGEDIGFFYFSVIMGSTVLSSFMSTVQFVSISAFMTSIADPLIGGTYMTLLNTFSNFGGTWPKFFVLESVDYFTKATCSIRDTNGLEFSCVGDTGGPQCKELGGNCVIIKDGYYTAGIICVVTGFILLFGYIRPIIYHLEGLSKRAWKISR